MPLRVSEWIFVIYFGWVILLLFFFSLAWRRRVWILLSNGALPMPEPTSALVFGLGLLIVGPAVSRSRSRR